MLCDLGRWVICLYPDILTAFSHSVIFFAGTADFSRHQSADFSDAGVNGREGNLDGAGRLGIGCSSCFGRLGPLWPDEGLGHKYL